MHFTLRFVLWLLAAPVVATPAIAQVAGTKAAASPVPAVEYADWPIESRVLGVPTPVPGDDGRWFVTYQLMVMNWAGSDVTLRSADVLDAKGGSVLAAYGSDSLQDVRRFWSPLPIGGGPRQVHSLAELRTLPSGRTAVLRIWLSAVSRADLPAVIRHRLTFEPNGAIGVRGLEHAAGEPIAVLTGEVEVSTAEVLAIDAPLKGSNWKCSHLADLDFHQSWIEILDGHLYAAQRFAIDFQKVDRAGDTLPSPFPNELSNEMFYSNGQEVLAVADGTVVYLKTDVASNTPLVSGMTNPPAPLTRESWPGNQIGLDIGGGRIAWYAHLMPGSIAVRTGDRVQRGQVIARIGNTGNAAGPHLHFHIGDSAMGLNACAGVPFVFRRFELEWRSTADHKARPADAAAVDHTGEAPLDGSVVGF